MRREIELCQVTDRAALHRVLAETLCFPAWYGENLDALYDCLTQIAEPTELFVRGGAALEAHLGGYAAAFRRVLHESAAENPALVVHWEE